MSALKKSTIYLDPKVHRAIRLKAAADDQSVSDLVNEALKVYLNEDAEDLADVKSRSKTGSFTSYEDVLKGLKKDGLI